ncbi:WD repeat-containing protein 91 [Schistocerca serialis cubense]|uniref:WD repeat-containing protein 91 n=1 Tax=Schistocerca serialis cubense TaxID=2023355 RepID=UPI00214E773B|nr:WD repeat-containing protein 91 [Schistocerca serialis cubense]
MSHVQYLDELIREYLVFRGFSSTLKAFDSDLKIEKDKGFRVDRIVEQLAQYISAYDLLALRELWQHLDQKMFSKLEHHFSPAVKKMENAVLKLYLVNAVTNNKPEKVTDFFAKMTPELSSQSEWKEWFMLPFIKCPEENPTFAVHFTRQWQDTLFVSLHNFLAMIFQCMPLPTLANYEEDAARMRRLQEENDMLRHKLAQIDNTKATPSDGPSLIEGVQPTELMDDFYIIAQETLNSGESQSKTLKNLIRNIGSGLPASPILNRKSSQAGTVSRRMSSSPSVEEPQKRTVSKQQQQAHRPGGGMTRSTVSAGKLAPTDAKRRTSSESPSSSSVDRRSAQKSVPLDEDSDTPRFLLLIKREYGQHAGSVCHCKFNSSGTALATADTDGVIKLWTTTPALKTAATFVTKNSVLSLDWVMKDERFVISGHKAGLIRLHDNSKMVWELNSESDSLLQDSWVVDIQCSPTDSTFVCSVVGDQGNGSGKLLLYDIKTRKLESSMSLPTDDIVANYVTFNHNGQLLIAGCNDGSVRIYDVRSSDCIDVWPAHQGAIESIEMTADFTACYTMGRDGKLSQRSLNQRGQVLWEATLPELFNMDAMTKPHGQLFTWDPSGTYVLLCGNAGGVICQPSGCTLSPVQELKRYKSPGPKSYGVSGLSIDWTIADQLATVVTGLNDGTIFMSMLLTP